MAGRARYVPWIEDWLCVTMEGVWISWAAIAVKRGSVPLVGALAMCVAGAARHRLGSSVSIASTVAAWMCLRRREVRFPLDIMKTKGTSGPECEPRFLIQLGGPDL